MGWCQWHCYTNITRLYPHGWWLQAENALSVLALANRSDIPVYIGAELLSDEEL